MALLADILGENLPLVRRFKDPSMTGDGQSAPSRIGLLLRLEGRIRRASEPEAGPEIADSLGFYDPPKSGHGRVPAYFFRDPGGQLPVTATLYHEVSHQLLFETAGPNAYTKNVGNYWVFEGLGTYFETVSPQPDGSLEVGGLVGRAHRGGASSRWSTGASHIPLAEFVALDENAFMTKTSDLSPLPASDGLDRLSHAVARGDLPRRIPRLRSGRLPRADQARHGPDAARPPGPAVRDPRQPVPRVPERRAGAAARQERAKAEANPSRAIRTVPSR